MNPVTYNCKAIKLLFDMALPFVFCLSSPKPVFHLNGKRSHQQKSPQEIITPQHEEMIRYIQESKLDGHYTYHLPSSVC